MKTLTNKNILLAITGSISAYKAPDIISTLKSLGADVKVILTKGGSKFITKLSLQAISKNEVRENLWNEKAELAMGHIELARWADIILIAPASANTIANITHGVANDLLSAVILAADSKIIIAPAMNHKMYQSYINQNNIKSLKKRNIKIIKPDYGNLACGEIGIGRLPKAEEIADTVSKSFKTTNLTAKKTMITIGATKEYIDPVRYISNNSSGKMGSELANALIEAGSEVLIICADVTVTMPEKANIINVISCDDMYRAVMNNIDDIDIFIGCAAVSDYKMKNIAEHKIKKTNNLELSLIKNKDILQEVAMLKNRPITIGFAAETKNIIEYAKKKLLAKNLDLIIANNVAKKKSGFNADKNEVWLISENNNKKIALNLKEKIAKKIVAFISKNFNFKKN